MFKKFLIVGLVVSQLSCKTAKKQNFVFILVDDMGWADLGYTGSTFYETPNIDALSKSSIQFSNAYASASICSPTRASILTGKHPARLQITDWIPGDDNQDRKLIGPKDLDALPLEEVTLAEILKQQGYNTFFAGKWHLGDEGLLPQNQGFDVNLGGFHKGQPPGGYYVPYKNPYLPDGPEGEHLTDRLTTESIKFLDTIKDKPFLLYLSYYTVHTPIQANTKYIDKFKHKLKTMDTLMPSDRNEGSAITKIVQRNPEYASMVYALDENVGRLIKKLKDEGLYENTTIIFTSDNGGLTTIEAGLNYERPTAVVPLRGGKGWLYEGGIRVPLLIKPAHYNSVAHVVSEPVISHDFFPTMLSLANITSEKNMEIDGVNLVPLLIGNKIDRKEIFWHYPHYHASGWTPGAAIRQGDWKLIEFYETGVVELHNLTEDISEKNNLASKYPERAAALKQRLHELQESMNASKATLNSNFKK
ncbi:sulfatase [Mariniflexile maritimum]|uniref:sulfatase n=1 Tax=Mariniflexile maritimum TaxID=2682493 RepID=UPI0012F6D133|nr:sulfatase [Mariniflexile maritimum]